ncbi:hypothetical protein CC78DRAFT_337837 [Lojkania enalia]|uniref:Mid2 domain-containing protein n=1 Tax=Lojkania enalia TaxID=147567 RepID=A0A9P4K4A3_9PLEO|nr:hypothetical protein CC78DRAFT_337837 [Didymosphaeria enalia]
MKIAPIIAFVFPTITAGTYHVYLDRRQEFTDAAGSSVLSVLATAIPPETISYAIANPTGFQSELVSSLLAGETPQWYLDLPSDVKIYLATAAVGTGGTTSTSLASSAVNTAPITSPPTSPSATSTGTASSAVSEQTPDSSSNGLSTGAKIGIGIGVPVFALIIGASVGFFLLGRRRSRRNDQSANAQNPPAAGPPGQTEYKGPDFPQAPVQYNWPAQQYPQQNPQPPHYPQYSELGTTANTHEMQGNPYQGYKPDMQGTQNPANVQYYSS